MYLSDLSIDLSIDRVLEIGLGLNAAFSVSHLGLCASLLGLVSDFKHQSGFKNNLVIVSQNDFFTVCPSVSLKVPQRGCQCKDFVKEILLLQNVNSIPCHRRPLGKQARCENVLLPGHLLRLIICCCDPPSPKTPPPPPTPTSFCRGFV